MNLLPPEILAEIYVYCLDERLMLINKTFWAIGRDLRTRGNLLISRHKTDYLGLVQDEYFDGEVAKYLASKFRSKLLVEIFTEWSTAVGDTKLLEWLIPEVQFDDRKGLTDDIKGRALVQSSLLGFFPNVDLLLKNYTGTECFTTDPNFDNTASLCMAAKYGHFQCVKALVERGANIHVEEDYPLCWASRQGHYSVVVYLVSKGAHVDARRNCALQWASEQNHLRIVEFLLDNHADIHSNDDHSLRWACVHGHYDIAKLLLTRGANVNAANSYSLRNAVKMRHIAIIQLLLQFGADRTAENDEAFKWAAYNQDEEVLRILSDFRIERNVALEMMSTMQLEE